ncbi:flagellin [Noviherbaspirillum sp. Root189]|uniref:flagellin n=1 Tax=Noviherbaspirillum sp. Root189 TaxID=1736487 RepID=UPI00070C2950|nr:flagellin [Noviherbaspirillum sp. Root189]KRB93311.1 flagellin [Noviherbaspirillum sp. Root189]
MAAFINTNISSLNAQRNLNSSQGALASSLQRLSSGLRINSAKDDAAGLAITERMSTQIRGLNQAARNANDGISLAQTAEGALGEISNNLQRVRELAVQSRNATNSADDRAALQKEVAQLKSEIDRVANDTSFNGIKLLDGSFTSQAFQVGANQGQTISVDAITDANIAALGSWNAPATSTGVAPAGGGAAATATTTTQLGAITADAVSNADGQQFQLQIDGVDVLNVTQAAGAPETIDTARLQAAFDAFDTAQTGYTITGSLATNDLVVTKADGSDAAVTLTNTFNTGGTQTGQAGFVATHSNGTPAVAASFTALTGSAFTINGVDIEVGTAADATTRVNDLVTAINASSAGVTASVSSGALKLTSKIASDDIVIAGSGAVTAQTGLTAGTTAGAAQTGFASLDISTVDGADNAILAMDAALNAVNNARADLGAVQNRFTSVVANLQTTSENLSASRSRIQDADFAAETAQLTRGQILQQAGTAMLAQANSLPNGVLALLRG